MWRLEKNKNEREYLNDLTSLKLIEILKYRMWRQNLKELNNFVLDYYCMITNAFPTEW